MRKVMGVERSEELDAEERSMECGGAGQGWMARDPRPQLMTQRARQAWAPGRVARSGGGIPPVPAMKPPRRMGHPEEREGGG